MPIAKDLTQARKLAAVEFSLKESLERSFMTPLRRYLRDLSKEFRLYYSRTGSGFSTQEFDDELTVILRAHYRRVASAFKYGIRTTDNKTLLDDEIDALLKSYIDQHSIQQASIINSTNQKELTQYTAAAIAASMELNVPIQNRVIADAASREFNSHVVPKSELISTTETQNLAETTKSIEETSIFDAGAAMLGVLGIAGLAYNKTWVASLDKRTRHNHAIADGQQRMQNVPFDVGGERLMYPGDMSLSASLNNVINCRCSSILIQSR